MDISDISIREHVICTHYLRHLGSIFYKKPVGFNIISRDNPWDFKIELSTNLVLNIEITSIADDTDVFRILKSEERLCLNSEKERIPFYELEKLGGMFPQPEIIEQVGKYRKKGVEKTDEVPNPYFPNVPHLFLSSKGENKETLEHLIRVAIESKERKTHPEKKLTVLIIDNRTLLYDYSDLYAACNNLHQFLERSPFREIWFYTGYGSDLNGNNAEFSFAPLKVTEEQIEILKKLRNKNPPDENGVIYC